MIRGAFEVTIFDIDQFIVNKGDSYGIPSNAEHELKTIGKTEAIDVFAPPRDLSTAGGGTQE